MSATLSDFVNPDAEAVAQFTPAMARRQSDQIERALIAALAEMDGETGHERDSSRRIVMRLVRECRDARLRADRVFAAYCRAKRAARVVEAV